MRRTGTALGLAALAIAMASCSAASQPTRGGCIAITSSSPGFDPNALTIAGLSWGPGDADILIEADSGPFASASTNAHFFRLSYPGLVVSDWFSTSASGSQSGADGTIYWLDGSGLWSRGPGDPAGRLLIPMESALQHVISWRVTRDRILVLRDDTVGTLDAYTLNGDPAASPIPADPAAVKMWASTDGRQIVLTHVSDGSTTFAVYEDGHVVVVDPKIQVPTFEWLAHDGAQAILLDPDRGLVSISVAVGGSATVVGTGLPQDYWALSTPTSAGVIAYAPRGVSDQVCIATVPASARP